LQHKFRQPFYIYKISLNHFNQKYGGISRYYTEIFEILTKKSDIEIEVPLIYTKNIYFSESSLINKKQKRYAFLFNLITKAGISIRKKTRIINRNKTIKALKKQNFDLFIPTYYDTFFWEYIGTKPFVLTVYDMIHELFPQNTLEDSKLIQDKLLLMEKAAKIIAVSNNTKKDILKIYPHIEESKIEVIYHGNSIEVNKNAEIDLPLRYILFVGMRSGYKNFNFLLNSIKELLKEDSSLFLVCAGGGKFKAQEKELISKLGLKNQIIHRDFNENELGVFYKKALCFVFPSIYEGFGIPVLESMACGCPIILTRNSSFPEVAGEAGLFYNLNDGNDLKNKIESLVTNESLRKEFSLKGLEQVKKFDWNVAAKQCLEVYFESIKNEQ
jgi:glycosyltransferase involved in cell wall biosynthesis